MLKLKKWNQFALSISLFSLIISGCAQKQETAPQAEKPAEAAKAQKVTVMLDWMPNTNHTGLYVAKDKGFYKEQGIEVEIIQPGEGSTADQLVAAGKADYGISYQEAVTQARSTDIPLISLAAIIQHNTSAFASKKSANIQTVKDFEGKRYGGWGSLVEEAVIKAVMDKAGADASKVENVTLGAVDFFTSIGRDADFEWIYYGWDGVEAKRRGIDLNLQYLKDLDPALDYYTPVIVTNEKHISEQAELTKKFMKATAEGYEFAIQHPKEAAEFLIKNAPELDPELVKASQEWVSQKYQDDAAQWGVQKKEVWENYAKWMNDRKLIEKMIEPEKAFTNEFLPSS